MQHEGNKPTERGITRVQNIRQKLSNIGVSFPFTYIMHMHQPSTSVNNILLVILSNRYSSSLNVSKPSQHSDPFYAPTLFLFQLFYSPLHFLLYVSNHSCHFYHTPQIRIPFISIAHSLFFSHHFTILLMPFLQFLPYPIL